MISFHSFNIISKINIGIHRYSVKNGGRARFTSLLLKYLNKIKIFRLYLFTEKNKEENEYAIPDNIKRVLINKKGNLIEFYFLFYMASQLKNEGSTMN